MVMKGMLSMTAVAPIRSRLCVSVSIAHFD